MPVMTDREIQVSALKRERARLEERKTTLDAARATVITEARAWARDSARDCLLRQAVERLAELEER